ncbi:MAG: diacylglycerol/lipid kinase family protein [Eubacteriales bacterium]
MKVKRTLPPVCDRQQVHLVNPASGGGADRLCAAVEKAAAQTGGRVVKSEHPGHMEELAAELCSRDPFVHLIVYGGDGSVYEAVNGILAADAGQTASFSVVPVGSGNDFSAYANDSGAFRKAELNKIDVIRASSGGAARYFVNMMNIGFDCDVVHETDTLKRMPFLHGSAAYLAGVAKTLLLKKPLCARVTVEGIEPLDGVPCAETEVFERNLLLTAAANARYCGGGFCAAPLALLNDGKMDVLVINDLSRRRFLSLVGAYKAGTYIDAQGRMEPAFAEIIAYRRCRKITVEGPERYCLDGEVYETGASRVVQAEVLPSALWYAAV